MSVCVRAYIYIYVCVCVCARARERMCIIYKHFVFTMVTSEYVIVGHE